MLERFKKLNINPAWIGLEAGSEEGGYFCTPEGMQVLGWENGIHYGMIQGFGDMIFAVNPEPFVDELVYPLAKNFEDLLRLILACNGISTVEQIISWDSAEQMEAYLADPEMNPYFPEKEAVLAAIKHELNLEPMPEPFEYVKAVQRDFEESGKRGGIRYSDEYYDVLGLERSDT